MPYDSDDYENDSVDWWDDVFVPHEDESFDDWRRKNNPMINYLEELRPLLNLDPGDAVLIFVHHYLALSYRAMEACKSLYNLPRSKSAIEDRMNKIYKKLGQPKRKSLKRERQKTGTRDRTLRCGFVCPECNKSVLAYTQPKNCSEHDNE